MDLCGSFDSWDWLDGPLVFFGRGDGVSVFLFASCFKVSPSSCKGDPDDPWPLRVFFRDFRIGSSVRKSLIKNLVDLQRETGLKL